MNRSKSYIKLCTLCKELEKQEEERRKLEVKLMREQEEKESLEKRAKAEAANKVAKEEAVS